MTRSIALTAFVAIQLAIALAAADFHLGELLARFSYLDSQWYIHIAENGYVQPAFDNNAGSQFAFFPLWPMLLRFAHQATGQNYLIIGPMLSFVFFVTGIGALAKNAIPGNGGYALTSAGWLALLFSPGSWVFLSNHTEGLFFLLTVLAFWRASRRDWFGAALFAGLSALTRNQGVLVIGAIALGHVVSARGDGRRPLPWAIAFSILAVAIAALWPIYEWANYGDAFAHFRAQKYWQVSFSFPRYVRNFFWLSTSYLPRTSIFWAGLFISVYLLFKRSDFRALGLYLLVSLLLLPLQGNNFPQAYRFSAVLFPLWFVLGDWLSKIVSFIPGQSISRHLGSAGLVLLILWHVRIACMYFYQFSWPY